MPSEEEDYGKLCQINVANRVLDVYKDQGLWEVNTATGGTRTISRNKITEQQYNTAKERLNKLDNNGMKQANKNELQKGN